MADSSLLNMDALKVSCRNCSLAQLCLPVMLSPADVDRVDQIVERCHPMHKGDYLFKQDEKFSTLYVVKSGSVKSFVTDADGSEQILGFHLPGELVGLEGIESDKHQCSARVMETSSFCEVPFEQLEALATRIPSLQHQVFKLLSKQIGAEANQLVLLGQKSADQRLACFLTNLSDRFASRNLSSSNFILSMSRSEIGNYLGLAVETVSRLFTRFQQDGILEVNRKQVIIKDLDKLKSIVSS